MDTINKKKKTIKELLEIKNVIEMRSPMEDLEDDVEGNLFPHPPKGVGGEMRQETGEREKRYNQRINRKSPTSKR